MVIRVTRRPYGIGLCLGFGDTPCVHFLHSRLEGERETARFSESGGRGIVLRFAAFYGPDPPSTVERPTLARRRMLLQVGPGTNYISSIYVPDAGRAVVAALGLPAGTYNVCDDGPVTFADYLRILIESIRAPRPFRFRASLGNGCSVMCGATLRALRGFAKLGLRKSLIGNRPSRVCSRAGRLLPLSWPIVSLQGTSR